MRLTLDLLKGDKVDSRVDYRDALPKNVSGVVRRILDVAGYMLQEPGLTQYATGLGIDRGGIWNERLERHFRVSDTQLITVDENGVVSNKGVISGTDTVSLPYSFNTQGIVANFKFFLFDLNTGLNEVTDVDLGSPLDCVWIDGYYFFTDGEFLYHTDLSDETSIDPLKFATSEFSPDPTLGVGKTTDNKAIAFNRYSIEYLENRATDQFAFSRLSARAVKYGIVGTHCKCEIGGAWFFMGGAKEESVSVFSLGLAAEEIASREVTQIIATYTEDQLALSTMESRVYDKIPVIIVHLPNDTLLFNIQVGKHSGTEYAWSRLTSDVSTNQVWRGLHGVFEPRKGVWVYGDNISSKIGILDSTVATQYDILIECELFTPFVYLETASIDELDIETIPGFNTVDDATVFFSITYDGNFYGNEVILQYGKPGDYGARFIARRLGEVSNVFSLKFRWASTSRMAFSKGIIDYG